MNKPAMIRAVYRELRAELGERVPASELLQCAADIVELATVAEYEPRFSLRTGGIPFCQWALDAAFADGGWRVLRHETELMHDVYDFDEGPFEHGHIFDQFDLEAA